MDEFDQAVLFVVTFIIVSGAVLGALFVLALLSAAVLFRRVWRWVWK